MEGLPWGEGWEERVEEKVWRGTTNNKGHLK